MKAVRRYRWTLFAVILIGVVAMIRVLGTSDTVERDGLTFVSPSLAGALDGQSTRPDLRVLASFEDSDRVPCRAFMASPVSGIACRERGGCHLRVIRDGVSLDDPAAVATTERALRDAVISLTDRG